MTIAELVTADDKPVKPVKPTKLRLVKPEAETGNVEIAPGVVVLDVKVSKDTAFANLPTAILRLVDLLKDAEDRKLAAARVIQAIDRQELWREAGCNSMKEFFPLLLQQTAAVGWGAERTVKSWLSFANLYLDGLEISESVAMVANSHLHAFIVLADIDRTSGGTELKDEGKEGKLASGDFAAIVNVLAGLVSVPTGEQKISGLDAETTRAALIAGKVAVADIEHYEARVGSAPQLPANGWTVGDTKALISLLQGKVEVSKAVQVFYLSFQDEERVEIDRVVWEFDGIEKYSQPWAKAVTKADFEAMTRGHKVVDASEGEAEDSDEAEDDDE